MNDLNQIKDLVNQANSIIIITSTNPDMDCVASSLALYLSLKDSGKKVIIASETDPIVRDSHLVGLDKVVKEIGNTNMVISIDSPQDSIEKVSHNDDGGRFNLVIEPKKDFGPLDKDKVTISYAGASADLVFVIGGNSLDSAGRILTSEEDLLRNTKVVNISNKNGNFGVVNMIDTKSSLSELTTAVIKEVGLTLTEDSAGNLLKGIMDYTNNLQSDNMTADTFEALAILYRAGAKRRGDATKPEVKEPERISTVPNEIPLSKSPRKPVSSSTPPSPDWLKPKIFKGSNV